MTAAYLELFQGGALNFDVFPSVVFRAELFWKHIENEKGSGGVRGHAHPENLHAVLAILLLFEQFLGKFCLNFLPLNLSVSPNTMHFVRLFLIMRS